MITMRFRRLGALCGGTLLVLACGPSADFAGLSKLPRPSAPAQLTGVVFEGYSAGSREVEVRAARADVDPDQRVVQLQKVQIRFQDPKRGEVRVNADRAEFSLDSDDFVLRDHVEGSTAKGERFTTAEVRYHQAEERLWTDRPVRLYRSNLLVESDGMEIDLSTRRIRLTGSVEAKVR